MSGDFDSRAFRSAVGCFATGVTVMTATDPAGASVGMTVNSFASLSLDPPLILWSIGKSAFSLPTFEVASHFAVNILADDQADMAGHFASKGIADKFLDATITSGMGNAPLLAGVAATLECARDQLIDGGDHIILIGRVEKLAVSGKRALVYSQGSYATAEPLPMTLPPRSEDRAPGAAATADFAQSHLDYLLHRAAFDFREALEADPNLRRLPLGAGRLLAILGDRAAPPSLAELAAVTLAPEDETKANLTDLVAWGLVSMSALAGGMAGFALTGRGEAQLHKLQADAARVEAEALAIFTPADAQKFKTMLRALAQHSAARAADISAALAAERESADA